MARNFERSVAADTLGLAGQRRFMSDIPSKTSEIKPPSGFRPLSPHLPLYQPQLSSTLSICNRIAGGFLVAVTLLFYMIYMKLGLVTLTYDSFYQFVFYSSKLHLLAVEISALAMSYHLYSAIRHLFIWYQSQLISEQYVWSWGNFISFLIHILIFYGRKTFIQLLEIMLQYLVFDID